MRVYSMGKWRFKGATLVAAVALLLTSPAMALEKLVGGIAGQVSPTTWPYYIAMAKGMLAKRGMEFDIVYGQSASNILQQLVGGSIDLVVSTGINEPMHAAAKGAPVGILRIVGKVPPYAIDAQKDIHSLKELKGKTVAIGGLTDITRLYFDRMLEPNGVKWGDYDPIVVGSTTGRMGALQSGAVAATMLLPPIPSGSRPRATTISASPSITRRTCPLPPACCRCPGRPSTPISHTGSTTPSMKASLG